MKKKESPVHTKLLTLFKKKLGVVISNDFLFKLTGQYNYTRRIRELRALGWKIVYSTTPRGYVLLSNRRNSFRADNYVNLKLRQEILEAYNYTCQLCGAHPSGKYSDGSPICVEVDHKIPLKKGGKTTKKNLWVLCRRCNASKNL